MKKLFSLLLIFFIFSFFFSHLVSPAQAALGDILNSPDMSQEKYIIGNTSQSGILDSINNGYTCALSGCYDSNHQLAKAGIIPVMGQTLTALYLHPPASSAEYFADVLDNMGFPGSSKVLAQGTGYQVLLPFLPIWKAFRNMAYSLYIIIFVVIGIMIMFRTKVNAQTIISIQTALPNLLITLILITFSYAIAGFMIDLMYLLIYLIVFLAQANGLIADASHYAIPRLMEHTGWTVIFKGENKLIQDISTAITSLFLGIDLTDDIVNKLLAGGPRSLAYLVVSACLAIQMLKLIWTLAKSYIMLLIQVFTSPIQILMNAMPGSKAFSGWLKKTASYLAPFPIVAAMFLFSAILIGPNIDYWETDPNNTEPNPFNTTPLVSDYNSTFPLPPFVGITDNQNHFNTKDILGFLGFMVILMTPAAAKMAQDALQQKESPYTSEIGAGLAMGWQVGGFPIRSAQHAYSQQHQARLQSKMLGDAIDRRGGGIQGQAQPPTGPDQPVG